MRDGLNLTRMREVSWRLLAPPKCGDALAATLPTPPAALALVQAHVIGRERVPFTAVAGDLENVELRRSAF